MSSPVATVTPVVEDGGLTLVEEDDVSFTLTLSREVHRLYGSYQDGDLSAGENLWAGLDLARRMVLMLQSTVKAGMPAMRLEVMAAQTSEMLAVLFGETSTGNTGGAGHLSAVSAPLRPVLPPPSRSSDSVQAGAVASSALTDLAGNSPASTDVQDLPSSWFQSLIWWRPRSVALRLVWGLSLCVVAAVVIDLPIAIMALFPSDLLPLACTYGCIALLVWHWRHWSSKVQGPLSPIARP